MLLLAVGSVLASVVPAAVVVTRRRKRRHAARKREEAARTPQPVSRGAPLSELLAQLPSERPAVGVPTVPPTVPPPLFVDGEPPPQQSLLERGLAAIGTGSIIGGGLVVSELSGRIVEDVLGGGEGKGNVARLGGPVTLLPFAVDAAVQKTLELVGVEEERHRKAAGQIGATAALVPPLVPLVATVHIASEVLEWISPEANRAVRDVVKQLDPTDPTSPVGAAVTAVADFLFKPPEPPPPPLKVLQLTPVEQQQVLAASVTQSRRMNAISDFSAL